MTPHSLGRLPLPKDKRDFLMEEVFDRKNVKLSEYTRKMWRRPVITNQGQFGTCEGHGWTAWLTDGPIEHPEILALRGDPDTARRYAERLYVAATGDTTMQEGAYSRQLVKQLLNRKLIGAYSRAALMQDGLDWLLNIGPVGHGSYWYYSMFEPVNSKGQLYSSNDGHDCWINVDESSGTAGGHFYLLDGIDLAPTTGKPFVRVHNSWGRGWGFDGTAKLSIEDLEILFVGDMWACEELQKV